MFVHSFEVLGDPIRRRLIELLAVGEAPAGDLSEAVQAEFGVSQPAVSRHLRVLRDNGFAEVRVDGARRIYSVRPEPFTEIDRWLENYGRVWDQALDALETELVRGRRASRMGDESEEEKTS